MPGGCRRVVSLAFLVLLAVSLAPGMGVLAAPAPPQPSATAHAPIRIDNDAGFTAANGVVSGNGTAADPYVIGPWDITTTASDGVAVGNTTAYFALQDMNVTGPGPPYFSPAYDGVVLVNVTHGTVLRLTVSAWDRDVVLEGGSSVAVQDSRIGNANDALVSHGTVGLTLTGNDLRSPFGTVRGFRLIDVPQATVSGNLFDFGGVYLDTTNRSILDSTSITTDNLIQGLPIRFYRQVAGLTVDGLLTGELIVADSSNVRLANLSITESEVGIQVAFVRGLDLASSVISYVRHSGVWLVNVTDAAIRGLQSYGAQESAAWLFNVANVTIASCVFDQNNGGLVLSTARDVRITDIASHSYGSGLAASAAQDFEILRSNLSWNTNGLSLVDVANGTVRGNEFFQDGPLSYGYPTGSAILVSSSSNVSFTGNNVTASGRGVWAEGSRGLLFATNRFVGNTQQASDDSTADAWNLSYPGGGNYWSDYTGFDDCRGPAQDDCTGSDGFGDTPYAIPTTPDIRTVLDHDSYPLVFSNPPNIPPVAIILASATSAWTGETVSFEGYYSIDPDGSIVAFAWNFGDGTTATDHFIRHAYATPGSYTVTLTVTDNRHATNTTSLHVNITTWVRPTVALVVWSSPEGYQVPIPSDWTRHENWTSGGTTSDLYVNGTYNGSAANLLVDSTPEPTAREDTAYLERLFNETVAGVRQQAPGVVATDVTYRTLSGHGAVVFVLRYGSLAYQDIALVSSQPHERIWLIILTASAAEEANLNGTFEQILDGFSITAAPPGGPGGLLGAAWPLWATVALVAAAGAGAAGVAAWLLLRRRKKRPAPPGTDATTDQEGPPKTP